MMSVLRRGDEQLHYSDNSHRWVAPPTIDQSAWNAGMQAHLDQHRTTMGGPLEADDVRECPTPRKSTRKPAPRIPRPRRAPDARVTRVR